MNPIKTALWNLTKRSAMKQRDDSVVLFGAWFGNRFADNSRYLYQYLFMHKKALGLTHVVWVTRQQHVCDEMRSMGYECYMMDSEESVHFHKTAGIHIICNSCEYGEGLLADILVQYSVGAKKVNLWHGLGGIKGVGFASKDYMDGLNARPLKKWLLLMMNRSRFCRRNVLKMGGWGDCCYLSTTPFETEILQKYFLRDKKHFIESAYPRNEACLKLLPSEKAVIAQIQDKKNIILYLPTFRDNTSDYRAPLEDAGLAALLAQSDCLWIEKKHSTVRDVQQPAHQHVMYLEPSMDISTVLPYADLVITDYSSVSWDAMYHNIPVMFYVPDLEAYGSRERGFVLELHEFMTGKKAETTEALTEYLRNTMGDFSALKNENYAEMRARVWNAPTDYRTIWTDILKALQEKM